mmetsp:Transcript_27206/g.49384  ORF Transcript_27206/g.49384 Transcript_27206/m.49384 type:complete len:317 (+) Transcript_27206:194-1144(+)
MSIPNPNTRDLSRLPKAELHLHLEGAMRPSTLKDLCRKYSMETPTIPTITSNSRFQDFSSFVDIYVAACTVLRREEDIHRLVLEVAQDLKECHVIYAEIAPSFTFYSQPYFGSSMEDTLRVLVDAASIAERDTGVMINYVVSVERHLGTDDAMKLAHLARKGATGMKINGRPAVVGFGLHGPEEGHPPRPFKEAFDLACKPCSKDDNDDDDYGVTIASLPHAGEIAPSPSTCTGAKSVLDAVQILNAKRIAHGVLAKDDAQAMQILKERDVVCDMGITSNFLLNVVESRKEHPITTFFEGGYQMHNQLGRSFAVRV